jgi:hypothetical protein
MISPTKTFLRRSCLILILAVLSVLLVPRTKPIRGYNKAPVGSASSKSLVA